MIRTARYALVSLASIALLQLAQVACADRTGDTPHGAADPTPSASAAPTSSSPSSCTHWQVAGYLQHTDLIGDKDGLTSPIDVPDGWEPIGASPYGCSSGGTCAGVIVRRCAD